MKCPTPHMIKNHGKRGQGEMKFVPVPCGSCYACSNNRRTDWSFRLRLENKYCVGSAFITLTYDDLRIPVVDGTISLDPSHITLFMKRLRKCFPNNLRYFLVGEYGGITQRPHYHMLLFNCGYNETFTLDQVYNSWKLGLVHIGKVSDASIHYCTRYILKEETVAPPGAVESFTRMSRRPGIGHAYINEMKSWHLDDYKNRDYLPGLGGDKNKLPRYLRQKIFTDTQRATLSQNNYNASWDQDLHEQRLESEKQLRYDRAMKQKSITKNNRL